MKRYVVGFMFDEIYKNVALIKKERPAWQKGLLNGIGGHIENGEMPVHAMVREFEEETGCLTDEEDWRSFLNLSGSDYRVNFYMTSGNLEKLRSVTDEEIVVRPVNDLGDVIFNLHWIIPMALDKAVIVANVSTN